MTKILTATWQAPASDGGAAVTEYDVGYAVNGATEVVAATGSVATEYVLNSADGDSLEIRVRAKNSIGAGAWSDAVSVVAATAPTPPVIVSHATDLSGGQFVGMYVNCGDNGGAEITGYRVVYTASDSAVEPITATGFEPQLSAAIVSGLTDGLWTAVATAINAAGLESAPGRAYEFIFGNYPSLTILTQPASTTAVDGEATFTVFIQNATDRPVSYRWQRQDSEGVWNNVGQATPYIMDTSNTLALTDLTEEADNGATYRVIINTNIAGDPGVISEAATLTVNPAPVITITEQPTDQTAAGGSATFTVAATVTQSATLSYQWEKQEGGAGAFAAVSGATSATLSLTGLTSADDNGDVYRCVASATGGATPVTSSSATLTVPEPAGDAPLLLVLGGDNAPRDYSPNNYWLTPYYYYSNGNTLAIENDGYNFWYLPYPSDAGPDGASSYAVGYDGYTGYALSLGLSRYANLSGVGESDFFSKVSSGPFTLEGWWKPSDDIANSNGYAERYFQIGRYVVAAQPEDQYYTDNYGYPAGVDAFGIFLDYPGNSDYVGFSQTGAPAANQWHHIALVDDGTEVRLYVDGALAASGAAVTWNSSNSYFDIGDTYGPWVSSFTGLRVTGSAIYTGNSITVPSANFPYTPRPTNPQTELLLNATHGLEDWGPRGQQLFLYNYYSGSWGFNSATGQGTTLNTTVKKFGAASYAMGVATAYRDNGMALQPVSFYTGGSNDPNTLTPGYLTGTLETGPFTVEMWVRPTGTINYSDIALGNDPSKGEAYISISYDYGVIAVYDNTQSNRKYQDNNDVIPAGLTLEFYDEINGVSHRISTGSLTRDEWHHLAVVADTANNALRLKVDGTDVGAIDITSLWGGKGSIYSNDYSTLAFGQLQHYDESYWWGLLQGYMDDLRVSNVALYGSSSYSVPTGALT